MPCEKFKAHLHAELDGMLSAEESRTLREHLSQCEACKAEWTALKQVREAVGALDTMNAPTDFKESLMEKIRPGETDISEESREQPVRSLFRRPLFTVAATLAIVGLTLYFSTFSRTGEKGPAAGRLEDRSFSTVEKQMEKKLVRGIETLEMAPAEREAELPARHEVLGEETVSRLEALGYVGSVAVAEPVNEASRTSIPGAPEETRVRMGRSDLDTIMVLNIEGAWSPPESLLALAVTPEPQPAMGKKQSKERPNDSELGLGDVGPGGIVAKRRIDVLQDEAGGYSTETGQWEYRVLEIDEADLERMLALLIESGPEKIVGGRLSLEEAEEDGFLVSSVDQDDAEEYRYTLTDSEVLWSAPQGKSERTDLSIGSGKEAFKLRDRLSVGIDPLKAKGKETVPGSVSGERQTRTRKILLVFPKREPAAEKSTDG